MGNGRLWCGCSIIKNSPRRPGPVAVYHRPARGVLRRHRQRLLRRRRVQLIVRCLQSYLACTRRSRASSPFDLRPQAFEHLGSRYPNHRANAATRICGGRCMLISVAVSLRCLLTLLHHPISTRGVQLARRLRGYPARRHSPVEANSRISSRTAKASAWSLT